MTQTPSPEDIARARVKRLTVVRFAGVALAITGVAVMAGRIDLPRLLGLLMVLGGVYYVLLFPTILIRRWKKGDLGTKADGARGQQ